MFSEFIEDDEETEISSLTSGERHALASWVRGHGYHVVVLASALWVSFDDSMLCSTVGQVRNWMDY